MPKMVSVKINNDSLRELTKNLSDLSKSKGEKIAQRSIYAASSLISAQARENIKEDDLIKSGNLERSVGVAGMQPQAGRVGVIIGIIKITGIEEHKIYKGDAAFEGITGSAWYGRFSDTGTVHEPARRWLQSAGASQAEACVGKFTERATMELNKAIEKMQVKRSLK